MVEITTTKFFGMPVFVLDEIEDHEYDIEYDYILPTQSGIRIVPVRQNMRTNILYLVGEKILISSEKYQEIISEGISFRKAALDRILRNKPMSVDRGSTTEILRALLAAG